jgi:H+/Cl- antiporter ClcA
MRNFALNTIITLMLAYVTLVIVNDFFMPMLISISVQAEQINWRNLCFVITGIFLFLAAIGYMVGAMFTRIGHLFDRRAMNRG